MINDRIKKLRERMKQEGIDVYYIPTADFHMSEYISDFFKCRRFISGFTGSAGDVVVTENEAVLFADGRYFVQAEKEINGSEIKLMKIGQKGVPELADYITEAAKGGKVVGFDGRVAAASFLKGKNQNIKSDVDLIGDIWEDRPAQCFNDSYLLSEEYAGESVASKLKRTGEKLAEKKADFMVLAGLDDIAWLFNLRGCDIECNPVAFAYAIVHLDEENVKAELFINEAGLSETDKNALQAAGVCIKGYGDFFSSLKETAKAGKTAFACSKKISYSIYDIIKECEVVDEETPVTLFKAVKNETEIKNLRKSHLADGIAVTKFHYLLKKMVSGGEEVTENSARELQDNLRAQCADIDTKYGKCTFKGLSFETISAFGENAAMMHYSSTGKEVLLKKGGMLLVDSGGQYFEGTTDITRTYAIGEQSEEAKKWYTLSLKSHLKLMGAKFLKGASGLSLDVLAREPLWKEAMDYKCGTGHGVGYFLNVHEGPNTFRPKSADGSFGAIMQEGMVTTDEPGVYIEGKLGIRIENELLCRVWTENDNGTFMEFESLTVAPYEPELIVKELLDKEDIELLNSYHAFVYDELSPYLTEDEAVWLKSCTKAI